MSSITTLRPSQPFPQDDSDLPEMPRPAPQPTSKPQLEDIFRGRRGDSAPLLTLKNLQAERLKYKQQAAGHKLNLMPIPENPTPENTQGALAHFQSTLEVSSKEAFSPAQTTPKRFRGGSMSDRKRRDLSAEIASATSSALASVQRAESRFKSPSPKHVRPTRGEDFSIEEEKASKPGPAAIVPMHDFKPSKDLMSARKEETTSPKQNPEQRKQSASGTQKREAGERYLDRKQAQKGSVARARSISPLRTLHQVLIKAQKDSHESKIPPKPDLKRKKITKTEASDLAKRLQSTSTVYDKL